MKPTLPPLRGREGPRWTRRGQGERRRPVALQGSGRRASLRPPATRHARPLLGKERGHCGWAGGLGGAPGGKAGNERGADRAARMYEERDALVSLCWFLPLVFLLDAHAAFPDTAAQRCPPWHTPPLGHETRTTSPDARGDPKNDEDPMRGKAVAQPKERTPSWKARAEGVVGHAPRTRPRAASRISGRAVYPREVATLDRSCRSARHGGANRRPRN